MDAKLEREAFGKAAEIADGFWMIATRHRPGLSRRMFEINNRCLVFRLRERDGVQVLLVANAVEPTQSLDEVRRLERETGLRVRYVLSVGGGHHLKLPLDQSLALVQDRLATRLPAFEAFERDRSRERVSEDERRWPVVAPTPPG